MGCADVCLDHGWDGHNELFRQQIRRAGKPHRCEECAEQIPTGAQHEYTVGKTDGELWSARTCGPCAEIRTAFVCGSFEFGQLWPSIREEIFPRWAEEGPFDCLAKLRTQAARDLIQGEHERWTAAGTG